MLQNDGELHAPRQHSTDLVSLFALFIQLYGDSLILFVVLGILLVCASFINKIVTI